MSKIGHNSPPIDVPKDIRNPRDYFRHLVRFSPVNTTAKAVGHELACCMDKDGFCWPSGKELMANTGIKDKRTMAEALRSIEAEIGLMIERKRGTHSQFQAPKVDTSNVPSQAKVGASNVGTSNVPTQKVVASNAPTFTEVVASNAPGLGNLGGDYRGGEEGLSQDNQTQLKTIDRVKKNILIKFSKRQLETAFEKFWDECPRKIGKGNARKFFDQIVTGKHKSAKQTDPEILTEAMQTYACVVADKEAEFICHPSTWLNGQRWLDEHEGTPKQKRWGWWRTIPGWDKLTIDQWRGMIKHHKPNGTWPWQELGPPPGHPECLLPAQAQDGYGDYYAEQAKQLETEFGGKND